MLAFATVNEEEAINQEVCLFVRAYAVGEGSQTDS